MARESRSASKTKNTYRRTGGKLRLWRYESSLDNLAQESTSNESLLRITFIYGGEPVKTIGNS